MIFQKYTFVYLWVIVLWLLSAGTGLAQQQDDKAFEILDKAIGLQEKEVDLAIYFEDMAFGVADPLAIFKLPAYAVQKGGFIYMKDDQYEIQLGILKALSDGKLSILVNEQERMVIVDSVRSGMAGFGEEGEQPDLQSLLKENLYNSQLSYVGLEEIQGNTCHKIKATFPDAQDTYVLYWVREKDHKLLLMVEKQGSNFDVYHIRKISKTPKDHQFTIHVPATEMTEFHGYEIFDFRYMAKGLEY